MTTININELLSKITFDERGLVPAIAQDVSTGQVLMMAALNAGRDQGYRQVSLTVHPQNPAIRLYQRCGFEKRDLRNGYHLMVATL